MEENWRTDRPSIEEVDHDEQLEIAIACSLQQLQESRHSSADLEMAAAVEESTLFESRAVKKRKAEEDDVFLQIQVYESVADAIVQQQSHRDSSLAADTEMQEALLVSQQEANVRRSLETWAQPRPIDERNEGSWDCIRCTFRNAPYAPACVACDSSPPPHVLSFSPVPNVQFGVEFEIVLSNGLSDGFSCEWLARELTRQNLPTSYVGYSHATTNCWKVVTDASLSSARSDLCCEVVSPVLVGDEGLRHMRLLLESLRRLGIDVNSTCGFHVHVDAEPSSAIPELSTLAGIKRLCQCFVSFERGFDALVGTRRRQGNRNRFCQSNRLAFGESSYKGRCKRIAGCVCVGYVVDLVSPDRYRKLNLTNLTNPSRPSTIEFRQHGGVDELLTAEAWVRLVLRFCYQAVNAEQPIESLCRLHQNATEQDEIGAIFELVQCDGLHSYYTLDRNLYQTATPIRNWKCQVCKRCFRDSRSLSQHARATGHHLER